MALVGVAVLVVLRTRRPPAAAPAETTSSTALEPQPSRTVVPPGTVDLDAMLAAVALPSAVGSEPVVLDLEDGTALVLGNTSLAQSFGEIIGTAGPRLISGSRRASTAVHAGIQAAEQAGLLVRLHPDSATALKTLKPDQVKDASGYVLSTLRGKDGKYRHVLRVKDVGKLQTLSAGAAVISALAMQAQLDRIEKQLGQIQAGVSEIQRTLDSQQASNRAALDQLFAEIYRTAHHTGQLTPAQWDQIAPHIKETYALREMTVRDLQHLQRKLLALPKQAKERSAELRQLSAEFDGLVVRLDSDDRRVGQAQSLRLWHLAVQQDPSLPATLADTRAQVEQRLQSRAQLLEQVQAAATDTDVRGVQAVHTRRRREIRESAFAIGMLALERREALPAGLAMGSAGHASPEEIALSYTLTPDEALVLAVAQGWLMSRCSQDEADHADTEAFLTATARTAATLERSTLSPASLNLVEQLALRDDLERRLHLKQFATFEALARPGVATRVRSLLLLIELSGFHPWSPKDPQRPLKTARKWNEKQRQEGLRRIAVALHGVGESDADRIREQSRDSAELLFRGSMFVPVALLLVGGVGAGVLTAGLAAPAIGALVGTTVFGLSGAAAASAGLAALGGGSIAAGGLGMAGGTALISATGGLLGLGLGAGAAAGAEAAADAQARVLGRLTADVIKLHALGVVVLIEELRDVAALDAVIQGLRTRREELRRIMESRTEQPESEVEGADAQETYEEETKRFKTAEQALTRAIDDLLKRRGVLVRPGD
jgi:hypothetical protein